MAPEKKKAKCKYTVSSIECFVGKQGNLATREEKLAAAYEAMTEGKKVIDKINWKGLNYYILEG